MNKAYQLCLPATNKLLAGLLTLMGFSMTTEVSFKKEELKGGDGNWYQGKAEKDVTITLEQAPKNKEQ